MKHSSTGLGGLFPLLALGLSVGSYHLQADAGPVRQDRPALAGSYALVSIDGHELPYAPRHPGMPANAPPPPMVVSSLFTISGDSTFQQTMSYRITREGAGQVMERNFRGTYLRKDSSYIFTWVNAGQTPVTLRGDTLVLNNEGMLFTYLRQRSTPRSGRSSWAFRKGRPRT